jgi:hypothetical protein
VAAPGVGWLYLSSLADDAGLVAGEPFEETLLYQMSAAAVALLGVFIAGHAWLARHGALAYGASAVLMVALLLQIGHYHPSNIQAYTAPIGVYIIVVASLLHRARGLPRDVEMLLEPLQAFGAALLMGPGLVQSWQDGGWPYALLLLVEGLALLAIGLVQRWLWLVSVSVTFVVLDAVRYLFDAARAMPNWATVAIAGLLLLAAGFGILLSRERWTEWQRTAQAWWRRRPLPAEERSSY